MTDRPATLEEKHEELMRALRNRAADYSAETERAFNRARFEYNETFTRLIFNQLKGPHQ